MKKLSLTTALFVYVLFLLCCNPDTSIGTVKIEGGLVEGITKGEITVFKGIPFAEPPIGDFRWKPPQPVKAWDGILKAEKFKPQCTQMKLDTIKTESSEDCLYLNVWTPAKSKKAKLPVMVWIHGGAFALGSTSIPDYDGENLAKMGVIVVSAAYRLGPFGFMAHPELTAESINHVSGNYGLLDQIEGLKWIQKNIAEFGGDPSRVTIFGESAGAMSVSMLCASPLAKGLFSGAISESGASFWPVGEWQVMTNFIQDLFNIDCIPSQASGEKLGVDFMKLLGCKNIFEMRKVSPEKLVNDTISRKIIFWPLVDGYVIPDDQYKLYQEGKYNDVNVIIGTNSDEGYWFTQSDKPEEYTNSVKMRFGPISEKILNLYPIDSATGSFRPIANLSRDSWFAWPSWTWARLQEKTGKSKVFLYYFDQFDPQPPAPGMPEPKGAAHYAEVTYVFRNLSPTPDSKVTGEQEALSEIMAKYWTNFAKTGDPNGEGLPFWPVYKDGETSVMYLKGIPKPINVPNLEQLQAMDEYFTWKRKNSNLLKLK